MREGRRKGKGKVGLQKGKEEERRKGNQGEKKREVRTKAGKKEKERKKDGNVQVAFSLLLSVLFLIFSILILSVSTCLSFMLLFERERYKTTVS